MASTLQRLRDVASGIPAISPLACALALRRPKRLPLFLADSVRLFRQHAGRRLPAITPWELLGFTGTASLRVGENGLYAALEPSLLLMQLAAMQQPRTIFEIGTSIGRTTALLAMNTPDTTTIYTLDLDPALPVPGQATDMHLIELAKQELGITFRDTSWAKRITQLLGDSATFDFSPYHDSVDLVIVDGSHSYPFARSDTLNAFRMIRAGGVIVWHDYESMRSEYGVTRIVDGLRRDHGIPTYRLGRDASDTRYGVLRVTAETKRKLLSLTLPAS